MEALRGKLSFFLLLIVSLCLCCCRKGSEGSDSAHLAEAVSKWPCFYSSNLERDFEAVEESLDLLKHDDSPKADQAVVMLMGYYLGEHNDEQLMIEIVRRGKRMKPLLTREMEKPASISTCAPSLEREVVSSHARSLISAIDKSEHWD
jgi:hypothetical protein